ncbi:cell division protein SepF [Salinarchaeum sp. IM2453]|uniref:cell division protein SepF n=1 Tax=Salinarchaeum sp. IM2453 TaxID=2862870 RepID=UPI001C82BDE5|nr:cell division protein SepF [Salinarchaeum sp. IM2453]QZA89624.1 cell division protein SepF [Salinarchaeum sp. IM2453]
MKMLKHVYPNRHRMSEDDYAEIDAPNTEHLNGPNGIAINIAEIRTQQDLLDAKDVLYGGDILVVYLEGEKSALSSSHIMDELRNTVEEVGGDIVQKGEDQLIVTPQTVQINRNKIGGE